MTVSGEAEAIVSNSSTCICGTCSTAFCPVLTGKVHPLPVRDSLGRAYGLSYG
ncbi:hypothetical protein GCM10009863_14890 [Streptomyces axinellae]|uniref:Uncharacterized protein n=1 Tax=Streptomyces axinellae TaxID=552788 RepID=A0ABP6C4S5_9ACTN